MLQARHHKLDTAPHQAAHDHSGDQRDIHRPISAGKNTVQDPGNRAIGGQLKRHGRRRISRRHPKEKGPQQRGNKSHRQSPRPAANKAAQQCRNVHWAEHGSNLRDLSRQKRQDQCNGKIQRRVGKLSDLHRRTCIVPGHRHAVSPISVSSWRICSIASSMMAEDFWLTPAT